MEELEQELLGLSAIADPIERGEHLLALHEHFEAGPWLGMLDEAVAAIDPGLEAELGIDEMRDGDREIEALLKQFSSEVSEQLSLDTPKKVRRPRRAMHI